MNTTSFLWRLFCFRWRQFSADLVAMLIFTGGRLFFGLILQGFFNALPLYHQASPTLWLWVILLALVGLIRGIGMLVGDYFAIGNNFDITALLQRNLLTRILTRPGARAVPGSPGEAISNLRDDTEISLQMINTCINLLGQTVFTVGALIIMFRVNATMTILVVLPLVIVIAIVQAMKKRLSSYRKASRQATSNLTGALGEIFGSVQAIQVAGAETEVVAHVKALNDQRRKLILKDTIFSDTLNAGFSNTVGIVKGLILILAALFLHTFLHIGDLALFLSYIGNISGFIQSSGSFLALLTQTRVSHERLVALLQGADERQLVVTDPLYIRGKEPPMYTLPPHTEQDQLKLLAANNLTYCYPDTGRGIHNIHLSLPRGTITVITGRIGSGKTTLLQVLLGLLPKNEGEICWNGEAITDPASFFAPPHSAYTAQIPHLFSDSLKENILLGLPEKDDALQQAIHTAVLDHDVTMLENGIDTVIGVRGVKLSGGQAQRTAAARMIIRDSELLVFDDLSSALDVETEQLLWQRLFTHQNYTCLVVSHRKTVLQRADHIIVMKGGSIEAEGTLSELLTSSQEMQLLWHGGWQEKDPAIEESARYY
jgi:ATP-binding cassette subfamily B protein